MLCYVMYDEVRPSDQDRARFGFKKQSAAPPQKGPALAPAPLSDRKGQ